MNRPPSLLIAPLLVLCLALASGRAAANLPTIAPFLPALIAAETETAGTDSMVIQHFRSADYDQDEDRPHEREEWADRPLSEDMLTDVEPWHAVERGHQDLDFLGDYNRVDPFRLGARWRYHDPDAWTPGLGLRYEYAFGRSRALYGAQIEQPIAPHGRLALGARLSRRTDHNDTQQMGDFENSLTLLFTRADLRDYFEREGTAAYLVWRVPDFSTMSAQWRTDDYRTLQTRDDANSWIHNNRPLRENPAIEDGKSDSWMLRMERPISVRWRPRAGLYHWIELERAGHGMGGDFEFTRGLADLRSVLRVSPATTLTVRAVGGNTWDGHLPTQRQFTMGGPDGLRAHPVDTFRGDRMALAQAEYDVALWWHARKFETGLHVLAFLDTGRAWNGTGSSWDVARQRFETDGGVGVATSEDALRIYFAKDLHDLNRDFVLSVRFQRPF